MFTDVEKGLIEKISGMPDEWRSAKYSAAAYEVVLHYTGMDLRDSMFSSFHIHGGEISEPRLDWMGSSIFSLRNDPILPELRERLQKRDLRSTFFEISAAASCKDLGYSVIPGPGIKKKGLDFDFALDALNGEFSMLRHQEREIEPTINVEVTEFQAFNLEKERVIGRLKSKRKQLPQDEPSILICHLPFQWTLSTSFSKDLDEIAERFLKNTKRINVLYFSIEQIMPDIKLHLIRYISYVNRKARNHCPLLESSTISFYRKLIANFTEEGSRVGHLHLFKRWVDGLIP